MFLSNPISNILENAEVAENIIEAERTGIGYVLNWVRLIRNGVSINSNNSNGNKIYDNA